LSLAGDTYRPIFLWLHSQSDWGACNNNHVWWQEDSFCAFVESPDEDDEEEGHEYWYLPGEKGTEKEVEC
jgi:hypothetical protein